MFACSSWQIQKSSLYLGVCGYSSKEELEKEVGSSFTEEISDPIASAVASMFDFYKPEFALSLEGGGLFMRYPTDSPTSKPLKEQDELFQILTEAYARIHPNMLKVFY